MQSIPFRFKRRAGIALSLATASCGMGLLPVFSNQLRAGTERSDVTDASFLALGASSNYASVGAMTFDGLFASGVLITPKWVLTAAHTTNTNTTRTYYFGTNVYTGTGGVTDTFRVADSDFNSAHLEQGSDIGLSLLSSAVTSVAPTSRLFDTNNGEITQVGTFVGFGQSGDGNSGAPIGASQPYTNPRWVAAGTKRAETNVLDVTGSAVAGYSDKIALSDFDNPAGGTNFYGTTITALEGSIAPGDSGGGAFVDFDGRTYLAGINSFIGSYPSASGGDGTTNASYSDIFGVTRVTQFNTWIDSYIVNYWAGAASGSSTFGTPASWSLGTGSHQVSTGATPASYDIAGLNQSGTYTLNLSSNVDNWQLLAMQGNVTLGLGGHTYTLNSSMYDGGVVVGRYSGDVASVTVQSGTMLSHDAIIGQQSGASGKVTIGSGATWTINGDAYVGGSAYGTGGTGTLAVTNSNSTFAVSGRLRVFNAGTVNYNAGTFSAGSIDIQGGGKMLLTTGGNKVIQTKSVAIAATGKIDLADNDMIVDYDSGSPLSLIKSFITRGYNGSTWNGDGITTSVGSYLLRIGFGEASTLHLSSFDGIGVDSTAVLVKYTYGGDANLDGKVDQNDLALLASDWGASSGGTWTVGDFNYDGRVDVGDLNVLARNWQAGVSGGALSEPLSISTALAEVNLTAVPEPTGVGVILLAIGGLTARRRRHANR